MFLPVEQELRRPRKLPVVLLIKQKNGGVGYLDPKKSFMVVARVLVRLCWPTVVDMEYQSKKGTLGR
jgi:hypothetical protein